jgi:hypothetical protein
VAPAAGNLEFLTGLIDIVEIKPLAGSREGDRVRAILSLA